MSDAAAGRLADRKQGEFEEHVLKCSDCRDEFGRVKALLEAIDRGMVERAALEPSSDFVARVRRSIARDEAPSQSRRAWWAPAVACTAVILIAAAIWLMLPGGMQPGTTTKALRPNAPVTEANHTMVGQAVAGTQPSPEKKTPALTAMHKVPAAARQRISREPDVAPVIIPPGEGEAVLQFAAALRSGKIDGAKLLAGLKNADQPIEIKPLAIEPLEPATQTDNAGAGPGSNGAKKNFVGDESTRAITP